MRRRMAAALWSSSGLPRGGGGGGGGGGVGSVRLRCGRGGVLIEQDDVDEAGGDALGEAGGDVLNEERGARLAKRLGEGCERLRIETFTRGEHLNDA